MSDVRIIDEALVGLIGAEDEQAIYRAMTEAVHALEPDIRLAVSALAGTSEGSGVMRSGAEFRPLSAWREA